jgi:hypothetical protein
VKRLGRGRFGVVVERKGGDRIEKRIIERE